MSAGRNGEASAIATLALEVQRSPAKHAELLRGNASLPSSIAVLLRLAGGTALKDLDPALAAVASENELRKAALFFIEQVLFQREANHYRVLGLNQGATQEQIKEHHRLLMRLFHPDRESQSDEHREQFATRANLAYNTLRDADARTAYDERLKPPQAPRMQAPQRAPVMARHRMPSQPESFWSLRIYPLLMRYLPQWVLAGTALVSVTVVGFVYLINQPVNLQQNMAFSGAQEFSSSPETRPVGGGVVASVDGMMPDEVISQFERRVADASQAISVTTSATDAGPPPSAQDRVKDPVREPLKVLAAVKPVPAVQMSPQPVRVKSAVATETKPAIAVSARITQVEPAPAAVPVAVTAVAIRTTAPEPVRSVTPVEASSKTIAEPAQSSVVETPPTPLPDPNTLLAQFLKAYERGDVQDCMALLDEGMVAKQELRRQYDELFRGTDLRHIKILSMSWSREGDSFRGEGQYRSTMMRKGESILKSQVGQIRVELIRRGGTALISELQYITSSRS